MSQTREQQRAALVEQGAEALAEQLLAAQDKAAKSDATIAELETTVAGQAEELKAARAAANNGGMAFTVVHGKKTGTITKGAVIKGVPYTAEQISTDKKLVEFLHDKKSALITWNN